MVHPRHAVLRLYVTLFFDVRSDDAQNTLLLLLETMLYSYCGQIAILTVLKTSISTSI
jgi:hypothetical protein